MTLETPPDYQQIIGEQLSGVTFVMDYLQLQFNPPPTINVYTPLTVRRDDVTVTSGDDQFRNKICEQIMKIVKSVEIKDEEAFLIGFEDGSEISISLKPEDYVGPEALVFWDRDGKWIMVI
jgi:hypothetical protein